ncbi:tail protein [Salsuginibacillus halophilus]|uniref:Tail protein n=2 Tax=Salsuginibacillus halophilus TaxID=517424 RepID=A0A2P8H675_9BACI|nr:tail protein [Salsuginibacillus halophilus]
MITYTNANGESITMNRDSTFRVVEFNGRGGADADVQMQKPPFFDGGQLVDVAFEERELELEVEIKSTDTAEHRRKLARVFNPKLKAGTLSYETSDGEWLIDCVATGVPQFPSKESSTGHQRCTVDLIAPNPYWRTPEIETSPTFEPLFKFPFEGSFEMGIQRDARIIDNDGDAPCPLQIEFNGPAENPRIENVTTGEYIKVKQTLQSSEVLKIDTTPGDKSVVIEESDGTQRNVFNWIDLQSTFFQLEVGENEIEYTADDDIQGAIVDMYYNKRYVGV